MDVDRVPARPDFRVPLLQQVKVTADELMRIIRQAVGTKVVDELRATAEARDKAQKDLQVQKTELVGEALRLNGEVLQAQQESSIWEAKVTSLENEIKLLQKNISSNLDIVAPLGQRQVSGPLSDGQCG